MNAAPIDIVVRASAVLAAAGLADLALSRRASAATRHLVWSLAIAAMLLLPIGLAALPQWQVRIPVQRTPAIATACPDAGPKACATETTRAGSLAAESTDATAALIAGRWAPTARAIEGGIAAARTPAAWPVTPIAMLYVLYGIGLVVLVARLAIEPLALRRLTQGSRGLVDPASRRLLEECMLELRVSRPVRLLQSRGEIMPMTFGTRQPTIVVPASAGQWTEDRWRAVLLHELAHVARRDCLTQRLTACACAIYWPHPGVWFAARRLRVERELACDDRVLEAGAGPREYAGHLLELAHSLGASPAPATALGMARARQLERRLLAILDAARNRATLRRRGHLVAFALSVACFLPVAGLRAAIVARGSEPPDPVVQQTERGPAAASDLSGTWDLRLSRDFDTVQVSVRTEHGNHGRTVRLDQLPGLSRDQIMSSSATVRLPITREAGTFNVDGTCRAGVCAGTFTFNPSSSFAAELARRGLDRPTPRQQMDLAIADVGLGYLDALAAAGYPKPTLELLVRAAQHGVSMDYLRGMTALGYRTGSLDALVQLRDHGVDPDFIRGMEAAGYAHLTAEELRNARDHGADPTFASGLAALGYKNLPLDVLIGARDHGVDPEYVRGMQSFGYRFTLDGLVRTRDHGVDPQYVRGLSSLGYGGLTIDALVGARDHGVDPEYVRGMASLGYKGAPLDDLIRMRDHGVDPEYVRRVQRRGAHPSIDEIIRMRDRGADRS
jgi:beta-lactamase regulating signal transducer with metallopeptidase domain